MENLQCKYPVTVQILRIYSADYAVLVSTY